MFYRTPVFINSNNVDPDQMPHSVVFYLGRYCLPIIHLRVSRLKWVKIYHKSVLQETDENWKLDTRTRGVQ